MISTLNRGLIRVLQARYGCRLGRRLAVVAYVGRRSGRRQRLVTQYVVVDGAVRIRVGRAADKTWWRNFQSPHPLDLHLAGELHHLLGRIVREGDQVYVVAALRDAPGGRAAA